MATRKPTPRSERREAERGAEKLARDRAKLYRLEAGGAPDRPIPVETPALVDVTARSLRCPTCDTALRLDEHAAAVVDGISLRVAHLSCPGCARNWARWYRVTPRLLQ